LQFGELPTFRGVIGKLIVGEDCPGNNVRSHIQPPFLLEHDHSSLFCKNLRGLVSLKFWIEEKVDSAKNRICSDFAACRLATSMSISAKVGEAKKGR
jgi:hypothetical protein